MFTRQLVSRLITGAAKATGRCSGSPPIDRKTWNRLVGPLGSGLFAPLCLKHTSRHLATLSHPYFTSTNAAMRVSWGGAETERAVLAPSLVQMMRRGLSEKLQRKKKRLARTAKKHKLKTRKAAADRFFPIAGGLFKRWSAGKSHNQTKKAKNRRQRLVGSKAVTANWQLKRLRLLMPYNTPKGFVRYELR